MEKRRHVPAVAPPLASSHGRGQEQLPPMPCPIEMHRNIPVPAWGKAAAATAPFGGGDLGFGGCNTAGGLNSYSLQSMVRSSSGKAAPLASAPAALQRALSYTGGAG